jgi:hypothetical protein
MDMETPEDYEALLEYGGTRTVPTKPSAGSSWSWPGPSACPRARSSVARVARKLALALPPGTGVRLERLEAACLLMT